MDKMPEGLTSDQQKNWEAEQSPNTPIDKEIDITTLKLRAKELELKLNLWKNKQPESLVVSETKSELDRVNQRIAELEGSN